MNQGQRETTEVQEFMKQHCHKV